MFKTMCNISFLKFLVWHAIAALVFIPYYYTINTTARKERGKMIKRRPAPPCPCDRGWSGSKCPLGSILCGGRTVCEQLISRLISGRKIWCQCARQLGSEISIEMEMKLWDEVNSRGVGASSSSRVGLGHWLSLVWVVGAVGPWCVAGWGTALYEWSDSTCGLSKRAPWLWTQLSVMSVLV